VGAVTPSTRPARRKEERRRLRCRRRAIIIGQAARDRQEAP